MSHYALEIERFEALIQSFCHVLMASVEKAGGDPDYLESWSEKMTDDVKTAFMKADERRSESARPPKPYSTHNPVQLGTVSTVARVG